MWWVSMICSAKNRCKLFVSVVIEGAHVLPVHGVTNVYGCNWPHQDELFLGEQWFQTEILRIYTLWLASLGGEKMKKIALKATKPFTASTATFHRRLGRGSFGHGVSPYTGPPGQVQGAPPSARSGTTGSGNRQTLEKTAEPHRFCES